MVLFVSCTFSLPTFSMKDSPECETNPQIITIPDLPFIQPSTKWFGLFSNLESWLGWSVAFDNLSLVIEEDAPPELKKWFIRGWAKKYNKKLHELLKDQVPEFNKQTK